MQSMDRDSQGWEVFGPPKGMQRPLHLLKQSQESLRRSATGTDNREMGAAFHSPARGRYWEGHPSAPGRSMVPRCHQGRCQEPVSLVLLP